MTLTQLTVKVVPLSKKTGFSGKMSDGTYKIKLTQPPVDNKANEALMTFLSHILNLPSHAITLVSGSTQTKKRLSIKGKTLEEIDHAFNTVIL